ncbi:MAG: polyribonucleotide nucleotidyltransferase [Candidatus Omnitrophica bacterium]|nr:polyribonucleotide nucleotidyltransferase [Candidatus Omnitrophota bacterium]
MNTCKIEVPFGPQTLTIETGKLAKQANAAVILNMGGTTVLVTACMAKKANEDVDYFPLMVEYQEKTYSAGRIPGGFFKREGRPTQKEILTSRLIDRPIRPLFPLGFYNDVQIVATVLSSDGENDPDIMAIVGASAALHISDIPFGGPVGAVRVGLVDGNFIINPTYKQRETSEIELVVVGLSDGVVMIEGESKQAPENKVTEALQFAFKALQPIREVQEKFREMAGSEKSNVEIFSAPAGLKEFVLGKVGNRLEDVYNTAEKNAREGLRQNLLDELSADVTSYSQFKIKGKEISAGDIAKIFDEIEYDHVRHMIFTKGIRADGRPLKEVREITCEIDVLPRTHGSSLFTRGQTQSLAVVTLGTKKDEQLIEGLEGVSYQNFMLHYNFPSFSTGETKPIRSPGRREIGHGALAAKALQAVLPDSEKFPYTVRVVSEILESNGSSSMASVCAGCLSLMAAGVPICDMVAGISIGLVSEGSNHKLITDIMGLEDHFGDMDFKVAGTSKGVTAIQLDIKVGGIPLPVLIEALGQSKEARGEILKKMEAVISKPKSDLSEYAPRIIVTHVPQDKIGEVIGPGGKVIKKIIEDTGCESIDIDDDGTVLIASLSKESGEKALRYVNGLVEEPQIGKIYDAKVVRIANFGAFCEFLPEKTGLVHISELSSDFVKDINTVVKIGDTFKVKIVEIDQMKRVNLSKKQAEKS